MKKDFYFQSLLTFIFMLTTVSLFAVNTITVKLQDSDGTLLTGGTLMYHDGSWKTATDNSDGTFSLSTSASSVTYQMTYNNGRQTKSNISSLTDPVIFQTVTTTVALKTSDGTSLGTDGSVRYHQVTWKYFGSSNSTIELLPGKYTFEMTYNNGRQTFSNHSIPDGSSPPATHEVLFKTVTTTVALKTSDGISLDTDGSVRYHQVTWKNFGLSNSAKELLPGRYTFEMTYNNGRQTFSNHSIPDGSSPPATHEVLFKTVTTTVALKDCSGVELGTAGNVKYHQVGWKSFGTSNSTKELLPGKYTFEMTYNNGRQTFSNHSIPEIAEKEVLYKTATVDYAYKGTIRYHQVGWQNFTGPKELLPGIYTFQFGTYTQRYTFAACDKAIKTVVIFDLEYADGKGAPNGVGEVSYGGWKRAPGVTDKNGILIALFDGSFTGKRKFRMKYPTSSAVSPYSKEIYFNLSTSSVVKFKLSRVTARLWDGTECLPEVNGGDLGNLFVSIGGWKKIGSTDDGKMVFDIFASNRKFKMQDVNYSKFEKYYDIPVGYYNMDFPVIREIVKAKDQNGNLVTDTDFKAWISSGGWKSLGSDSDDGRDGIIKKGVLQGNWKFKMELGHSSYEKYWNSTQAVFPAVRDFIQVKDQSDTHLITGDPDSKVWVSYGGWKYIGIDSDDGNVDGKVPGVLLEGNRKFKMELGPSSYEKYWNYKQSTPDVVFPAVRNPVVVHDQNGTLMPDSEAPVSKKAWVSYGGWKLLGNFSGGVWHGVLLEGNRKFKAEVNYSSYEKYCHIKQDNGSGSPVAADFPVLKDPVFLGNSCQGVPGGHAYVSYGGWKDLGVTTADGYIKNMSLLAGNRKFKMKLPSGSSQEKYVNIKHSPLKIAEFGAAEVNFHYAGNVLYKVGSRWYTYISPSVLFYGVYQFKFDTYQTSIDVSGCNLNKTALIYHLDHSSYVGGGALDASGLMKIGSSWITASGTTNNDGDLIALFDGVHTGNKILKMKIHAGTPGFTSYSKEKTENISTTSVVKFKLTDAHFRAWDPTASQVVTSSLGGDPEGKVSVKVGSSYKELGVLGTSGDLHIEMFAQTHNFLCSNYNFVRQYKNSYNLGLNNIVNFNTRMKAVAAKDGSGGIPNVAVSVKEGSTYRSLGTTDENGDIAFALLHGTYNFSGYINNTIQYKNSQNVASGQVILTGHIDPLRVVDNDNGVEGVKAYVKEGSSYKLMGTTNSDGWIKNHPLMRGTFNFRGTINHTTQYKNSVNTNSNPALLTARINPVKVMDGTTGVSGVNVFVKEGSTYYSLGNTDANGIIQNVPLMRGTFNFRGKINHTTQDKNSVNTNSDPALLTARINPVRVMDGTTGVSGVNVFVKEGSTYYSLGNTDGSGIIQNVPLMRGTFNFKGYINHTTQYKNSVNTYTNIATLDAVLKPVKLVNSTGSPLSGGKAYVKEGSTYYPIGTTKTDGYTDMAIMNATFNFRMNINSDVYYKNSASPVVIFTANGLKSGFLADNSEEIFNSEKSYKLYPVPASTELNINLNYNAKEKVHYQIINVTGRVIKENVWMLNKGLNKLQLSVYDLVDGQYIFLLKSNNKIISEKFIVSKLDD